MFQTCVGQIGINPTDFWLMSYKEIILALRGHQAQELEEWKRSRFIGYMVYCSIPKKKGTSNTSIDRFMPLGDKKNQLSREAFNQMRKVFTDRIKPKEDESKE